MNKQFSNILSGVAILISLIAISLSLTNQGNRNPYVNSSSYICLVYGMTSTATRQACGLA